MRAAACAGATGAAGHPVGSPPSPSPTTGSRSRPCPRAGSAFFEKRGDLRISQYLNGLRVSGIATFAGRLREGSVRGSAEEPVFCPYGLASPGGRRAPMHQSLVGMSRGNVTASVAWAKAALSHVPTTRQNPSRSVVQTYPCDEAGRRLRI